MSLKRLKECCERYVHSSQPTHSNRQGNYIVDVQKCNQCGTRLRITFEVNELLGGEVIATPIKAESLD